MTEHSLMGSSKSNGIAERGIECVQEDRRRRSTRTRWTAPEGGYEQAATTERMDEDGDKALNQSSSCIGSSRNRNERQEYKGRGRTSGRH